MANDRLYFKCRNCGETKMLAKYYPTMGHGIWFPDAVSDWVKTHMECSPNFGMSNLRGDGCFDVFAESDERLSELWQPGEEG